MIFFPLISPFGDTTTKKVTKKPEVKKTERKTEMVFILDRSGSMYGLENDTIGGFNSMIEKQKNESGEAVVSTVLFDDKYDIIHDRLDLNSVPTLTEKEYYTRGSTALLDAVGKTIQRISGLHGKENDVPDNTLFVITTDGYENASREYTYESVKKLIEEKKKSGWEFVFLGANIDAVSVASDMGISANNAMNYCCDEESIRANYDCIDKMCCSLRKYGHIEEDCRQEVDELFAKKSKKKKA